MHAQTGFNRDVRLDARWRTPETSPAETRDAAVADVLNQTEMNGSSGV